MHALNALTLFVNPYVFSNLITRRKFEKKWKVSIGKEKTILFRNYYNKVAAAEAFSTQEVKLIEAFSKTMLDSHKSTATRIQDFWNGFAAALGICTTRGKIIRLYFGLIEDIKNKGKVTQFEPLLAAEIIDAFAWLFEIEAEELSRKIS